MVSQALVSLTDERTPAREVLGALVEPGIHWPADEEEGGY